MPSSRLLRTRTTWYYLGFSALFGDLGLCRQIHFPAPSLTTIAKPKCRHFLSIQLNAAVCILRRDLTLVYKRRPVRKEDIVVTHLVLSYINWLPTLLSSSDPIAFKENGTNPGSDQTTACRCERLRATAHPGAAPRHPTRIDIQPRFGMGPGFRSEYMLRSFYDDTDVS